MKIKQAHCISISRVDAQRLYQQGYNIVISPDGYETTEIANQKTNPVAVDFFSKNVEYYLLIDEDEAKALKKMHYKAMAYMFGGFLGLMVSINLVVLLKIINHMELKYLIAPLVVSYGAAHCFISLHEMAKSAENEFIKILKKYKLPLP